MKYAIIVCDCGYANRLGHLDVSAIICSAKDCEVEIRIGELTNELIEETLAEGRNEILKVVKNTLGIGALVECEFGRG